MGNSIASSVAQHPIADGHDAVEVFPERPRNFHFAVTWVGLFAHLDLIETTRPRHRFENASTSLALVPVVAPAPLVDQRVVEQPKHQDSSAAWEMVVPKMIRTGARTFVPAADAQRRGEKPERR